MTGRPPTVQPGLTVTQLAQVPVQVQCCVSPQWISMLWTRWKRHEWGARQRIKVCVVWVSCYTHVWIGSLQWSPGSDTKTSPSVSRDSAHPPDIDRQVWISAVVIMWTPRNAHRELMSTEKWEGDQEALSVSCADMCLFSVMWLCVWRMRGTRCWLPTCGSGRRGMMLIWSGIKRTMTGWRWSTSPAALCGGPTLSSITSTHVRHTDTHTHTHSHSCCNPPVSQGPMVQHPHCNTIS